MSILINTEFCALNRVITFTQLSNIIEDVFLACELSVACPPIEADLQTHCFEFDLTVISDDNYKPKVQEVLAPFMIFKENKAQTLFAVGSSTIEVEVVFIELDTSDRIIIKMHPIFDNNRCFTKGAYFDYSIKVSDNAVNWDVKESEKEVYCASLFSPHDTMSSYSKGVLAKAFTKLAEKTKNETIAIAQLLEKDKTLRPIIQTIKDDSLKQVVHLAVFSNALGDTQQYTIFIQGLNDDTALVKEKALELCPKAHILIPNVESK